MCVFISILKYQCLIYLCTQSVYWSISIYDISGEKSVKDRAEPFIIYYFNGFLAAILSASSHLLFVNVKTTEQNLYIQLLFSAYIYTYTIMSDGLSPYYIYFTLLVLLLRLTFVFHFSHFFATYSRRRRCYFPLQHKHILTSSLWLSTIAESAEREREKDYNKLREKKISIYFIKWGSKQYY